MSNPKKRLALAAQPLPADELPTEFLIFRRGMNETHKGVFLFDAEAARLVLAEQARSGVDLAIDLEHLSLDTESTSFDPDARGWCQLAVRGGELWAVNVRWTGDGAQRLSAKSQRYVSPVIERDERTKRVLSVYNIALCAQPATFGAQPLVAASKGSLTRGGSTVIRARITKDTAAVFCALARKRGTTPGALIRKFLVSLASSPHDAADKSLDLVREALGLEADAGRAEIVESLDSLFGLVGDEASEPVPDPLQSSAAPEPPAALNRAQLALLSKLGLPLTLEGWQALRVDPRGKGRGALPLSQAEVAACKRAKLPATRASLAALRRSVVRRAGR
jgi:hypothetical protein